MISSNKSISSTFNNKSKKLLLYCTTFGTILLASNVSLFAQEIETPDKNRPFFKSITTTLTKNLTPYETDHKLFPKTEIGTNDFGNWVFYYMPDSKDSGKRDFAIGYVPELLKLSLPFNDKIRLNLKHAFGANLGFTKIGLNKSINLEFDTNQNITIGAGIELITAYDIKEKRGNGNTTATVFARCEF